MWLKRLVGVSLIVTLLGMNTIVILGILAPDQKPAVTAAVAVAPTVTISTDQIALQIKNPATLTWTTTGSPTSCSASGSWMGAKTPFGSESTGRILKAGTYTYTLTCSNVAGSSDASVTLTVTDTPPTTQPSTGTQTTDAPKPVAKIYCGGRSPCYGKSEIASHSGQGNCWGYNIDRVINITGFDAAYHVVKSGISSIQVSGVCGTDLASSLKGSVTAGGQTRNHNATTKANSDKNMAPYFIGFYDATK